jgi:CheY-like chemotaxis protein
MKYLVQNKLCQEAAGEFNISPRSVAFLAQKIHQKSGTCTKTELVEKIMSSEFVKTPLIKKSSTPLKLRPQSRYTILIVEDNPIVQKVHTLLIENLGYLVDIASSGFEALRVVNNKSYALILMDIGLPDMSGIETTLKIRQQHGKYIPIIALTAFGESVEKECYQAGVDDFATKPILKSDLKRLLQKWVPLL